MKAEMMVKYGLQSVVVCFCLMMAATHLPTTHNIQHETTGMMGSHLLLEKNEGNKRKKQRLIFKWVMVKIK